MSAHFSNPVDYPWPLARHAWTAAVLLAAGNALSFVDRTILALLVEPIKADLHISDIRISLLSGFSFTVFHVLIALPVARLTDHGNRRNIVATAMLVWGCMTAACGLASSYLTLMFARAGSGAGKGALSPAALSMLADYFPKERLPLALGLFTTSIYVGNGFALLVGGAAVAAAVSAGAVTLPFLGELRPWQVVFIGVGAPGIVLAALMSAVHEPARRGIEGPAESHVHLRAIWRQIRLRRAEYTGLFAAFSLLVMQGSGSSAWIPAFFERKFHWGAAQIGPPYGAVVLLCGTSGALAGGQCARWLRGRGVVDANVHVIQLGLAALIPFAVSFALAPSPYAALALIAGMNFFAGFPFAGGFAAIQELTPNRMRAQITAAFLLCVNLFGGGAGPTLVALFTDVVFGQGARLPNSLALAAAITLPTAYVCLVLSRRSTRPSLRAGAG